MAKAMKTCNRCGVGGLQWRELSPGKFRLQDASGALHECHLPADVPLEVQEVEAKAGISELVIGGGVEQGNQATAAGDAHMTQSATTAADPQQLAHEWSEALAKMATGGEGEEKADTAKQLADLTQQLLQQAAQQATEKVTQAAKQAAAKGAKTQQEMAEKVAEAVEQAKKQLAEEMRQLTAPQMIQITIPNRDLTVEVNGEEHKQYAQLIKLLLLGVHVFLPGQAGSGKTTAAMHAARDLGKAFQREDYEFLTISVTEMTSESRLAGFYDAHGRIINTAFRRAYVEGHLFLLDECDAGNPNVLAFANMALSNGKAAFADGVHPAHEHFRCVVAGNTFGQGGSLLYVGRNALDAAFLDRFYFLPWEVDERLELAISRGYDLKSKEIPQWVGWVQQLRRKHGELGASAPQIVFSPRASIVGSKLLAAGVHTTFRDPKLAEALVWRGAKPEVRRKFEVS